MNSVALEDLVTDVVLSFCENLAELGCPQKEKDPDMWYRYLSPKQQRKVSDKLLTIMERNYKSAEVFENNEKKKSLKNEKSKRLRKQ